MAFNFSRFPGLDERYVEWLVQERALDAALHYEKLWRYYRNEMEEPALETGPVSECSRPYRQSQEYGLPSRITGVRHDFYGGVLGGLATGVQRKEVVIENDIRWRIDTMVDFLFGEPVVIRSTAGQQGRREEIEAILEAVLRANGGMSYLQQLALLGSVYGFVDVIMRWPGVEGSGWTGWSGEAAGDFAGVLERARGIFLEPIEAPRCVAILEEEDYRRIRFYVQHYWQLHNLLEDGERRLPIVGRNGLAPTRQKQTHNTEVIGPECWQRYEDGELVGEGENPLGVVPVVHIQNMPQGLQYEGQSDVEPLLGLQDELNTRLSDRANRITFQSFKMYLGKGIAGFEERAVAPGRMWSTENLDAQISEFGGDDGSPSEDLHINEIREALDKTSGVAPIAAGLLKGRIGNLTSAVALKMTLMGVLAKTQRKQLSYGKGLEDLCRLVLLALDRSGVYPNAPEEREVEIRWPNPLPENVIEKLQEAKLKRELGVPAEQVLHEIGYGGE
jgi:hypothetical protein